MLVGCCSGPGLIGANLIGLGGYMLNLEDGVTGAPCWCIAEFNVIALGYDSSRDWLLFTPFGFDFSISYYDLRACNAIDGLVATSLLDSTTATAIFSGDAAPTSTPDFESVRQSWFGICKRDSDDDYRIYGITRWTVDSEFEYIRVWSVKYDGSDFAEHVAYHTDTLTEEGAISSGFFGGGFNGGSPIAAVTGNGDIVTSGSNFVSSTTLPDARTIVRVNGSPVASISTSVSGQFPPAGVGATLGGGFVYLGAYFLPVVGNDADSDRLYFAFTKDGFIYQYYAIQIGWSDKFGGLMILWSLSSLSDPLAPAPPSYLYVTLATTTLAAGNILGQEGVTAYDFAPSAAPGVPPEPYSCVCVNFCSLPRPTDFEPAEITPTPPTCDDIYAGCDFTDHPLQTTVSFGKDCSTDDGMGFIVNVNGSIINGSWTLVNALSISSSLVTCVSYDKDGWVLPLVDWTAGVYDGGTAEDQYAATVAANAALPVPITVPYREEITTASFKREYWLVAMSAKTSCIDGLIYLIEYHITTIGYQFNWNGSDWVLDTNFSPNCVADYTDIVHKYPGRLMPDCSTIIFTDPPAITGMVTLFTYDACGTDSPDGLEIDAYIDTIP